MKFLRNQDKDVTVIKRLYIHLGGVIDINTAL